MKYRIKLLKPVATANAYGEETNAYGEETNAYELQRTVRAQRVKQSGNRSEEVGEHFPDYRAEYNIRDAHQVEENWRVQQLGGYLYTVVAIIPNLDRGMKTLVCERVNE